MSRKLQPQNKYKNYKKTETHITDICMCTFLLFIFWRKYSSFSQQHKQQN